jgi:hypothetical protein
MQGWIIAYNRFVHDVGFAVDAGKSPHDVLFLRNTFAVKQPEGAAITGDVSRLRLMDNTFAVSPQRRCCPMRTAAENRGNTCRKFCAERVPRAGAVAVRVAETTQRKLAAQAVRKGTKS